ncbi:MULTISPECIES: hypothetical protein [unclassified Methylophaga]|jgi:hypothetical protein|uniref:hypothetical protein n=1 Tax=unclassified Methylophaga TaxID=2629249 RepID=UPI0021740BB1|nr:MULTISPECIES: hypothetical protein [unclassified Methylophaga]MBL1457656.1 hypothetical protein [Methylophaga sp.]|tara:strand:- start:92 stop:271 length:180 start_codon:yes stop_codon:yes gene_type:complete
MIYWDLLSYAAWIISAGLLLWIVVDAVSVSRQFDEELLVSSREGSDELLEQIKQGGEDK